MTPLQTSRPYVGVTGFTTVEQIRTAVGCFRGTGLQSHNLMCGVLVDPALFAGGTTSARHVSQIELLVSIIAAAARGAFPVVHFVMHDRPNAFADELLRLLHALSAQNLPLAVQLNGTPDTGEVSKLREHFPNLTLIYQIRSELLHNGPAAVLREIASHGPGMFSHALIDPSCGTGREFAVADVLPVYQELRKHLPGLGLGFAGGLSGDTAESRVREIRAALGTEAFSIDAEGKLFTGTLLDTKKVVAYLRAATKGFDKA